MSGPTVTFIPAAGSPCRVIPESAQLTFLEPIGSHPANKKAPSKDGAYNFRATGAPSNAPEANYSHSPNGA